MRFITDINNNQDLLAKFTTYEALQNDLQSKLDAHHKGIEEVHTIAGANADNYFKTLIEDLKNLNLLPFDFSEETHGIRYDAESKHVWITKKKTKDMQ